MSLITIIQELMRFTKDHIFKLLIGAVIVALAVVGLRSYTGGYESKEVEIAHNQLNRRYQNDPASFQFLVVNEDGSFFNNSFIFDEYFSQSEIVEQIENQTGIQFNGWIKEEETLDLYKTRLFRGALAAIRNTSTDVITFRVLVGQSSEENLKIAQAYYELLVQGQVPFLKNQTITFINEPTIGELLPEAQFPDLAKKKTLQSSSAISKRSLIIFAIAGLILGLFITAGLLLLSGLFKEKITYAFDYSWAMDDQQIIFNQKKAQHVTLLDLINTPKNFKRVILSQGELTAIESLKELQHVNQTFDELVIIVQANITKKSWYHEQYQLAQLFKVPIKIIHII